MSQCSVSQIFATVSMNVVEHAAKDNESAECNSAITRGDRDGVGWTASTCTFG